MFPEAEPWSGASSLPATQPEQGGNSQQEDDRTPASSASKRAHPDCLSPGKMSCDAGAGYGGEVAKKTEGKGRKKSVTGVERWSVTLRVASCRTAAEPQTVVMLLPGWQPAGHPDEAGGLPASLSQPFPHRPL